MSGIYIHIPYCNQACHYCDFHFSTNFKTRKSLVSCLAKEIEMQKDFLEDKNLNTIYFGGGTPSVLTQVELAQIFASLKAHFSWDSNTEITLEANPDDLTISQLEIIKSFGINRLSIGIQSFENRFLEYFNRSHNAIQSLESITNAQQIGIHNISIDLIYGIPNQSLEDFKQDLQKAIELDTPHISAYCLTIEEKTVFGRWYKQKKLQAVDENIAAQQFELLIKVLTEHGYLHYEISNFAKQGFESQHNSSYWRQKPYLGIGPGAHSYDGVNRQYNISNNPKYIQSIQGNIVPVTEDSLSKEQKINEFILTRIRTSQGINLSELKNIFDFDLMKTQKPQINVFLNQGLILIVEESLLLSNKGKLFADKITEDLMV